MAQTTAPRIAPGTVNGRMVSFKIGDSELEAVRKISEKRNVPVSMWLREAAREKLRREAKRKAA